MSGFSFKGVHTSKFGIYTQDQSRTLLPPKREGKITIPGRSGYYDDVGAVYNERAESVLCSFVCPEGKTVPEVCREIAYWLSGSGRLIFDREPDKYYLARLSGGPPMSQHLKYGEFTITWSYNPPFAFGKTITEPLKNGENVIRNTSETDISNVTITAIKRSV